jgi:hypothetical protein
MKLKGKTKDVGGLFTTQRLSYYSIIFNEFDRVNEVAAIRDTYSWLFRKDSGVKMVTYGGVFVDEAFAKALSLAGVPREKVMDFLNRAGDKLSKIFKHPGKFLKNLIKSVSQGFIQFKEKFPHYLKKGLMEWIFGKVGGGKVDIPKDFSPQSILKLVLQVLGFTREYIRKKVAKVIGEKNVERIKRVWQLISYTMKEGLGGLWIKLKEFVGDLKEKIISAVKNWLIFELVTTAVAFVAKLFTPISGLVAIIKMIYNVIKFLIEKARQLKEVFQAIVTSLSEIVEGNITKAADKVEEVLGRLLSLAISFLAGLLNIRIVKGVRMAIKRIKDPIDAAITKLINKIASGLKKVGFKVKKGAKKIKEKIKNWWKAKKTFKTKDKKIHKVFFKGKSFKLMVASTAISVEEKLSDFQSNIDNLLNPKLKKRAEILIFSIYKKNKLLKLDAKKLVQASMGKKQISGESIENIDKNQLSIAISLKELYDIFGSHDTKEYGEGAKTKIGDLIVYMPKGKGVALRVVKVMQQKEFYGEKYNGIIASYKEGSIFLPYKEYGKKWDNPATPTFNPWLKSGNKAIIRIDKKHLNTGTKAGKVPKNVQTKIGYDSTGHWKFSGHLIAKILGGPGDYKSGNIVPMTHTANNTKKGMPGIEKPVLKDVKNYGVYDYSAEALYNNTQRPPYKIIVEAKRIYPTNKNPSDVPNKWDVDNT